MTLKTRTAREIEGNESERGESENLFIFVQVTLLIKFPPSAQVTTAGKGMIGSESSEL